MTDLTWKAVGAVDPLALIDARLQAHQALQWLARTAYANVDPMPGDGHSNLGWNDVYGALMTRPMSGGDIAIGLRLRDLTMFVERDGAVATAFSSGHVAERGRRPVDRRGVGTARPQGARSRAALWRRSAGTGNGA